MVEVTEADHVAIIEICQHIVPCDKAWCTEILSGKHDHWPPLQIHATHREAAAKAERDRLRAQASLEKIARSIGRETVARDDRGILFDDLPEEDKATVLEMLAAALADALESQHD